MPYKDIKKRNELVRLWRQRNSTYSKEYQRGHPEQRKDYEETNIHKVYARQKVRRAVKSGKLQKPDTCKFCDSNKIEAHHPDYSEPLNVMWLCKEHHEKEHSVH